MSITRWDRFRNIATLQDQMNRLFENSVQAGRTESRADDMGAGGGYL